MNPGDREMLIHWIRVQKRAEREAKDAKDQGAIWFRRAKLAQSKGEHELARRAQEQAIECRDRWQRAMAELEKARMERDVLSRTERLQRADQGALERAEAVQEQFRELGIQPEDDAFARLEREARADEAHQRLRAGLQQDHAPTRGSAAERHRGDQAGAAGADTGGEAGAPGDPDAALSGPDPAHPAFDADDALARLKQRMAEKGE